MANIPKITKSTADATINEALALSIGWKKSDLYLRKGLIYLDSIVADTGPVLRPLDYRSAEVCDSLKAKFGITVLGSTASWVHRGITIAISDPCIERAIVMCVIEGLRPRSRHPK